MSHVHLNAPLMWLAVFLVTVGAYFFVAALHERLPLPGRKVAKATQEQRGWALEVLGMVIVTGRHYLGANVTTETVHNWIVDARNFVADAWGNGEGSLIVVKSPGANQSDALSQVLDALGDLQRRCHAMPLGPFAKQFGADDFDFWEHYPDGRQS